jgi:hypothetical protein
VPIPHLAPLPGDTPPPQATPAVPKLDRPPFGYTLDQGGRAGRRNTAMIGVIKGTSDSERLAYEAQLKPTVRSNVKSK